MPDPVSSTGQARSGIQGISNTGFRLSRRCRNSGQRHQSRHAGESRHPDVVPAKAGNQTYIPPGFPRIESGAGSSSRFACTE